jgi:dipeptidyl aminopeptidase/acylaminoacyl peptidase
LIELSPSTYVARLRAPLFLIHGKDDPAVPFTETLRLDRAARAAGLPVTTAIVGSINHVEPGERAGPRDLAHLATTFYAFAVTSGVGARSAITSAARVP